MDRKEIVLDNGVKLVMINTDKFKTVTVNLFFEDKLNDFNINCNNLLVKLLVTETAKHSSRKEFKSYLKNMYDMKINSYNNTLGEVFSFSIVLDALNTKFTMNNENLLEKQFEVINEILYNPLISNNAFNEDYFNEIKNEYKQNISNIENYKEYIVRKKAINILGKDNNLLTSTYGDSEVLNKISNNDVYNKYSNLNSMCNKVVVCGEIDFEKVEEYANKYLKLEGNRNNYNYIHKNELKKYDDASYDSKFSQSSIAILYDLDIYVGEKENYAALVFIEMLNYYLFKIIREEHNFCYSIYISYLSSRGLCYLQSNIEEKNYEMTLKLIDEIINDLKNNIDEKVLLICKDKIITNVKKEVDNPLKIIVNDYNRGIYNTASSDEAIQLYSNVSPDEVKDIANKIQKKFSVILKEGN